MAVCRKGGIGRKEELCQGGNSPRKASNVGSHSHSSISCNRNTTVVEAGEANVPGMKNEAKNNGSSPRQRAKAVSRNRRQHNQCDKHGARSGRGWCQ